MRNRGGAVISIERVVKRFGDFVAVDGVDLEIPPRCIFGLIGPNGAGKSTLFRMICQLFPPDEGRITVCGETDPMAIKASLGYLPEEHHLYERLTALGYLRYFGDLLGLPRRRSEEVLDKVGLLHKAKSPISKLSKGMRQKIAFARTLLADPPVLILDEPTYGLDPRTAREMRGWIRDLAETKTVILSSHNMFESERLCQEVAILNRGKVVAKGPPRSLVRSITTEEVLEVGFRGNPDPILRAAASLPLQGPPAVEEDRARLFLMPGADPYDVLRILLDKVKGAPQGFGIEALIPREPTLEDVFIRVTGETDADFMRPDQLRPDQGPPGEVN